MALNIEEIIASVKEATVLELNDLVKAIEEEFGVTAAAPVAVAGGVLLAALKSKANSTLSLLVQVLRKSKLSKLFVKSLVLA